MKIEYKRKELGMNLEATSNELEVVFKNVLIIIITIVIAFLIVTKPQALEAFLPLISAFITTQISAN